jgi:Uma2 family endonuclease
MAIVEVAGPHVVPIPDPAELIAEDGIPLESPWHRAAIALLIEVLTYAWRHRDDFYVGGNMFVYFSQEQARNRDYRGPDFFFVDHVPRFPVRPYWATWLEGGRYPDLIIELTSPSTAEEDRTTKKALYEGTFRTREYFLHDPETHRTEGWRLGPASATSRSRRMPAVGCGARPCNSGWGRGRGRTARWPSPRSGPDSTPPRVSSWPWNPTPNASAPTPNTGEPTPSVSVPRPRRRSWTG